MGILGSIGNFIWSPFGKAHVDHKFDQQNPELLVKALKKNSRVQLSHYYIDDNNIVFNIRGCYDKDPNCYVRYVDCVQQGNFWGEQVVIPIRCSVNLLVGYFPLLSIGNTFKVSDFKLNVVVKSGSDVEKYTFNPEPKENNGDKNGYTVYWYFPHYNDMPFIVEEGDKVAVAINKGTLGNLKMSSFVVAGSIYA